MRELALATGNILDNADLIGTLERTKAAAPCHPQTTPSGGKAFSDGSTGPRR